MRPLKSDILEILIPLLLQVKLPLSPSLCQNWSLEPQELWLSMQEEIWQGAYM